MIEKISPEKLKEISTYTWREVNPHTFKNKETWETLRLILLHHPNPIVRHEAAYIIGDFNIHDLVPALIESVKYDPSIVAKHESAEAMAFIKGEAAKIAYDFLTSLFEEPKAYEEACYHDDVLMTAKEALTYLEVEVKS